MDHPKNAIITGASSGIGKELAKQLAGAKINLGLIARRKDELMALKREIEALHGVRVVIHASDVTDREACASAVASIEAELGPTDLLIANAGVSKTIPAKRFDLSSARSIYETNIFGVLHCLAPVLPGMIHRRKGHIVVISSLAGFVALSGSSVYCATKAALNSQMEGLSYELRAYNIKTTIACPGFVKTAMTDRQKFLPFALSAEDAARRIIRAMHGKRLYAPFPWRMYALVRFAAALPPWIKAFALSSTSALKVDKKGRSRA